VKKRLLSSIALISCLGGAVSCNDGNGDKNSTQTSGSAILKAAIDIDLATVQTLLIAPTGSEMTLVAAEDSQGAGA
jgi:hypothetical protein